MICSFNGCSVNKDLYKDIVKLKIEITLFH